MITYEKKYAQTVSSFWGNGKGAGTMIPKAYVRKQSFPLWGNRKGALLLILSVCLALSGTLTAQTAMNLIIHFKPTADFGTKVNIPTPMTLDFSDSSKVDDGNIVAWSWNFGDGAASTLQNPTHTYNAPGYYDVLLTVKSQAGCEATIKKTIYVENSAELSIKVNNPTQCPGENSFSYFCAGVLGNCSYNWDFGDGTTSSDKDPIHTYPGSGSFLVRLILLSDYRKDTIYTSVQVLRSTAITRQPESIISLCPGSMAIHLETAAEGDSLTYQWYKDGTIIDGACEPTYDRICENSLDYGAYNVKVAGKCGTATSKMSVVKTNNISILVKWDDVLFVSRRDSAGNPMDIVAFQWYRVDAGGNLIAINEKGNSQYYSEKGLAGTFAVKISYSDGTSAVSCPYTLIPVESGNIKIYPNPVKINEKISVFIDLSDKSVEGSVIEVFDMLGRLVKKETVTQTVTELYLNAAAGTYMFRITDTKDNITTHSVVLN